MNNKILCIVGPTASGKTSLSIALAGHLGGEIISGDSMQIYRKMDIGTAKPAKSEMCGIPHHMIDIIPPEEEYSAARYVADATAAAEDILSRGKLPIVVGGTGLYIDSLVRGTQFAELEEDKEYRNELFGIYEKFGPEYLHGLLREKDPERASQIHPNNIKRVIRALEVYKLSGETITEHDIKEKKLPPRFDATYIGLAFKSREKLYERINRRVDIMLKNGLADETRALIQSGVPENATSMQAIGYKELVSYLRGECSLDESAEKIKMATRRYAKRQMTWFKRNKNINWIYVDEYENFSDLLQVSINFISF